MTDWKALCAELLDGIDEFTTVCDTGEPFYCLMARARAALDQPEPAGPMDEELLDLAVELDDVPVHAPFAFAREVLKRWGR